MLDVTAVVPRMALFDDYCFFSQGSRDNMSIEIVTFPGAPTVSEEAVKKEAELDATIEAIVKGRVSSERKGGGGNL